MRPRIESLAPRRLLRQNQNRSGNRRLRAGWDSPEWSVSLPYQSVLPCPLPCGSGSNRVQLSHLIVSLQTSTCTAFPLETLSYLQGWCDRPVQQSPRHEHPASCCAATRAPSTLREEERGS